MPWLCHRAYAVRMDSVATAWWRWWHGSPARDVLQALVMTALTLIGAYGESYPRQPSDKIVNGHPVPHPPTALFLLVAVAALALIWRRRYPVPVLCVSLAAVLAYSLLGYVNGAALLSPAVALYSVTSSVSVRRAVTWASVTLAALLAGTAIRNPLGTFGGGFDLIPAMVAAALFGGIAVANRRAFVDSLQARADDAAQRRIDEERLRIARELHDVVAHTMATINVQAGAAIHVAAERPEAATEALQAIRGASKDGLRELRAILNVLRQADEPDTTMPAPGLAQVDALIASASRAGLRTALSVTGTQRPVPPAIDLAAYRIVQESLTNAIRHAGPATATVSLGYSAGMLVIEVTDTGLGAPPDVAPSGGGHGLTGMRERAASVGGTLEAGLAPGGGFRVSARLPLAGEAAPAQTAPVTEGTHP
jgi:signal transduction histidine kinase